MWLEGRGHNGEYRRTDTNDDQEHQSQSDFFSGCLMTARWINYSDWRKMLHIFP